MTYENRKCSFWHFEKEKKMLPVQAFLFSMGTGIILFCNYFQRYVFCTNILHLTFFICFVASVKSCNFPKKKLFSVFIHWFSNLLYVIFFTQYFPALRFDFVIVIGFCLINWLDAFHFHCLAIVGGRHNPVSQIFSHVIWADKSATI